eukprot:TRINITY_DN35143_c0_g1_i1.p1 TRINITY_DN35143_c0_g1~~TRINITY_DN35143_c0_g1_i1.p1  ORF type:complete len:135 (+),score=29.63 TRINITY_DN35143_c0_g1_i1:33-407(+)
MAALLACNCEGHRSLRSKRDKEKVLRVLEMKKDKLVTKAGTAKKGQRVKLLQQYCVVVKQLRRVTILLPISCPIILLRWANLSTLRFPRDVVRLIDSYLLDQPATEKDLRLAKLCYERNKSRLS